MATTAPHPAEHLSASFSATIRVSLENRPGAFARLATAVADEGGLLDAIDLVRVEDDRKLRDVTVLGADADHIGRIVAAVRALDGVTVEHVSDRTFLLHLGGKLEMRAKSPIKTRDDLSMAYTPGVARVCRAIAEYPERVWNLTIKHNTVAVVTDGSAVLGLGDIGPEAALPVMEGKAILFKEFGDVDSWPICLATNDPDEIVRCVTAIAPGFGGINLEDISAPRCFEIEERLRATLDIPVFHDDQHGTAVVVLAALLNALKVVGKGSRTSASSSRASAPPASRRRRCCSRLASRRWSGATGAEQSARAGLASTDTRRRTRRSRTRAVWQARRTRCSMAPMSSSVFQGLVSSLPKASAGWRRAQSSLRWRTRRPKCSPRRSRSSSP